jgi:hypothetical protein
MLSEGRHKRHEELSDWAQARSNVMPPVLTRTPTEEHTCTEPAGCVHPVTLRRASRRRPAAHRQPGLRAVGLDYQQTFMSPAVPQQSPPSVGEIPPPNKLQPTRNYQKTSITADPHILPHIYRNILKRQAGDIQHARPN